MQVNFLVFSTTAGNQIWRPYDRPAQGVGLDRTLACTVNGPGSMTRAAIPIGVAGLPGAEKYGK